MSVCRRTTDARTGSVAVELAVLLPLIMFMAIIGVDYARIFSRTLILEAASRNGGFYACQDPTHANDTAGIQAVTLADVTDVSPTPTVNSNVFNGSDGNQYVSVSVKKTFNTITKFPGVPSSSNLNRTTTYRVCPASPKPGTYKNW